MNPITAEYQEQIGNRRPPLLDHAVFSDSQLQAMAEYRAKTGQDFMTGQMDYSEILALRNALKKTRTTGEPGRQEKREYLALVEFRRLRPKDDLKHWSDGQLMQRAHEFARV